MIRSGVLLAAVGSFIFLWHECGEDLGVFCYRISLNVFTGLRSRRLVLMPVPHSRQLSAARNGSECFRPSFTSSNHFTTQRD